MLHEAKRQSTIGGTKKSIGFDVGIFVGMVMFNVWTQTHGLGRWTRQSLLVITLGAAQGRHGYV